VNKELLSLELKSRPKNFDEFYGNNALKIGLKKAIESRKKRSFLFYGPSGCGKTTLARICANFINAEINEVNAADKGKKDDGRRINFESEYKAFDGRDAAYIIDEPQESSSGFQETLLKTIEEPKSHAWFFLCTTDPQKIKKTLIKRCAGYNVRKFTEKESIKLLKSICKKENKKVDIEILKIIADVNEGAPREMVVALDKIIDIEDKKTQIKLVESGIPSSKNPEIKELCRNLMNGDFEKTNKILNNLEFRYEAEGIRHGILKYFNSCCRKSTDEKFLKIAKWFEENFYDSGYIGLRNACYDACEEE